MVCNIGSKGRKTIFDCGKHCQPPFIPILGWIALRSAPSTEGKAAGNRGIPKALESNNSVWHTKSWQVVPTEICRVLTA